MFPETIETESLVLRRLAPSHVDVFDLYECFEAGSDRAAGVFEYVPQEPFDSVKDAHDWLRDAESEWEAGESAKYGLFGDDEGTVQDRDRETDPGKDGLVGAGGLSLDWDRRTGRPGVFLARPYWGRGYAGECATALTELAFDRLDLELVSLSYDGDNERSKRAIEKFVDRVGGRHDGDLRNWTPLGDEVVDNHRYTVTRAEFRGPAGDG